MLNSQTESQSCQIIPLRSSCNPHSLLFIHRSQQRHTSSIALPIPSHVVVRTPFVHHSILLHSSFITRSQQHHICFLRSAALYTCRHCADYTKSLSCAHSFVRHSILIHVSLTPRSQQHHICFLRKPALSTCKHCADYANSLRCAHSFVHHSLLIHTSFATASHLLPAVGCVVHTQALCRRCTITLLRARIRS